MSDTSSIVPNSVSRFFDNYLKCLINASIPEKQRRWYVKRVEAFIKTQNGHKIKGLSGSDIDRYFEMIGRQNHLAGWQFHQCIDAIRMLYCDLLKTQACQDINWDYWFDSAKQLEVDHPTTARQMTPEEMSYIKEGSIRVSPRFFADFSARLFYSMNGYRWLFFYCFFKNIYYCCAAGALSSQRACAVECGQRVN